MILYFLRFRFSQIAQISQIRNLSQMAQTHRFRFDNVLHREGYIRLSVKICEQKQNTFCQWEDSREYKSAKSAREPLPTGSVAQK